MNLEKAKAKVQARLAWVANNPEFESEGDTVVKVLLAEVEWLTAANTEFQEDIKGWEEMTQQILLSLRDQFAMHGLSSLAASEDETGETRSVEERAAWCYAQADAMIAARKVVRP